MRRYWKLGRFCITVLARTCYLTVALPFTTNRSLLRSDHQRRACIAVSKILRLKLNIVGVVPNGAPAVIVSNHIGLADPIALGMLINVAFTGKAEILTWPVVRWICHTVGLIPVSRDRAMRTRELVEQIRARLANSVSVVLFPEGTTSNGESVLPFKSAAFASVEKQADFSVTPVCLVANADQDSVTWGDNTPLNDAAMRLFRLRDISYTVQFGNPIVASVDRKELADTCFRIITDMHSSIRIETMNFERRIG